MLRLTYGSFLSLRMHQPPQDALNWMQMTSTSSQLCQWL